MSLEVKNLKGKIQNCRVKIDDDIKLFVKANSVSEKYEKYADIVVNQTKITKAKKNLWNNHKTMVNPYSEDSWTPEQEEIVAIAKENERRGGSPTLHDFPVKDNAPALG